jgi:hypothetical protein
MRGSHPPAVERVPTSRGEVRLTDDAIVFEESAAGRFRSTFESYWRNGNRWQKGFYAATVLGLLYSLGSLSWRILSGAVSPQFGGAVVLSIVVGIGLLRVVDYARGFRSPDRIPLDAVETVSATRGSKGLTRPRLVITYTSGTNSYRRRVNLPSLYTPNGERHYERALWVFREGGFAPLAASESRERAQTGR